MSRVVDEYRIDLEEMGFFYRMTEWHQGVQVCAFHRTNPHKYCMVSSWKPTETEAILEIFPEILKMDLEMRNQKTAEKGG